MLLGFLMIYSAHLAHKLTVVRLPETSRTIINHPLFFKAMDQYTFIIHHKKLGEKNSSASSWVLKG